MAARGPGWPQRLPRLQRTGDSGGCWRGLARAPARRRRGRAGRRRRVRVLGGEPGVAAGAAWLAPRPVVVAVALAAAAVCAYSSQSPWWLLGEPGMLVALALLARGKERMPRSWLWLFGIVIVG